MDVALLIIGILILIVCSLILGRDIWKDRRKVSFYLTKSIKINKRTVFEVFDVKVLNQAYQDINIEHIYLQTTKQHIINLDGFFVVPKVIPRKEAFDFHFQIPDEETGGKLMKTVELGDGTPEYVTIIDSLGTPYQAKIPNHISLKQRTRTEFEQTRLNES